MTETSNKRLERTHHQPASFLSCVGEPLKRRRYTTKLSMEFVNHHYSIWIEAEEWAPGERTPADDNSNVIVTFPHDERWVATFFSYQNIRSLIEKNLASGECLGGKYLAATQMILVDEVCRERIEEVVADLMKQNEFSSYFARCDDFVDVEV